MAVNRNLDKVVVVIDGTEFGFTTLSAAISFTEEQLKGEKDYNKVINSIATALSDDKEDDLQIFDIDTYAELFLDDEEIDDEDDNV